MLPDKKAVLAVGNEIKLQGVVLSNDIHSNTDGLDSLIVKTADGDVIVEYFYGEYPPCLNPSAEARKVNKGDVVEVFGDVTSISSVSICDSNNYYVKKI